MRINRKSLCWLLLVVMLFWALSSVGCGGGGSSGGDGGNGGEDVYVPDNPNAESEDNPAPAPAPTSSDTHAPAPNSNTGEGPDITGTWRVVSGKEIEVINNNDHENILTKAEPSTVIITCENTFQDYKTFRINGYSGVVCDFQRDATSWSTNIHFIMTGTMYRYVGDNTYRCDDDIVDENMQPIGIIYSEIFKLLDDGKLECRIINPMLPTNTSYTREMQLVLECVN